MTAPAASDQRLRTSARDLAQIAVFAALIVALTLPGTIPFGPVPITLQTLGVMLAGAVLGARKGALAVLLYLAVGAIGLPVFANGTGGLAPFAGPTGGYLVGFAAGAFVIGWIAARLAPRLRFVPLLVATVVGGVVVVYLIGVPLLAVSLGLPFGQALAVGLVPFLVGDAIKAVVAAGVAAGVHRAWPGLIAAREWPWARRADAASPAPVAAAGDAKDAASA